MNSACVPTQQSRQTTLGRDESVNVATNCDNWFAVCPVPWATSLYIRTVREHHVETARQGDNEYSCKAFYPLAWQHWKVATPASRHPVMSLVLHELGDCAQPLFPGPPGFK